MVLEADGKNWLDREHGQEGSTNKSEGMQKQTSLKLLKTEKKVRLAILPTS